MSDIRIGFLSLVALATGCPSETVPMGGPCAAGDTCESGSRCVEGVCRKSCASDAGCPSDSTCDRGVCQPMVGGDPFPGDPAAGDPVAGDPSAGDAASGDPGCGDPLVGDPGPGDSLEGDPAAAGDPAAGDSGVGDSSSGDSWGDPGGGDSDATGRPFLIVADRTAGVLIWKNADSFGDGEDRSPDVTLDGATSPIGLALYGDTLLVATSASDYPIYIYEDISHASDGMSYSDRIPVSTFSDTPIPAALMDMSVDAAGNLWIVDGSIRLVEGAAIDGSAAPAEVVFIHEFGQIASVAHDVAGDKLLGGQLGKVVAWDNADDRATSGPHSPDWELHATAGCGSLVIAGGDLYGACNDYPPPAPNPVLAVWRGIAELSEPTSPLAVSVGTTALAHLSLSGDSLVVSAGSPGMAYVFTNVSTISVPRDPDVTITLQAGTTLRRAVLDSNNHVFMQVGGSVGQGVLIYREATTTPSEVTKITTGLSSVAWIELLE